MFLEGLYVERGENPWFVSIPFLALIKKMLLVCDVYHLKSRPDSVSHEAEGTHVSSTYPDGMCSTEASASSPIFGGC